MNQVAAFFLFVAGLMAPDWKFEFAKDGITIWSAKVKGTRYRVMKGAVDVDQAPHAIWEGLQDPPRVMKVMPLFLKFEEVGTCGERCKLIYQVMHKEGVSDRHCITKTRWEFTGEGSGLAVRQWWVMDEKQPLPKADLVKPGKLWGSWNVVPLDGGARAAFTTTAFIDPAGGAGPFFAFVNKAAKQITYDFLVRMRTQVPAWKP